MHAKTKASAKAGPPVPSCKPIATARDVTVAECDEGIPPDPSILLESHLFSLNLHNPLYYQWNKKEEAKEEQPSIALGFR